MTGLFLIVVYLIFIGLSFSRWRCPHRQPAGMKGKFAIVGEDTANWGEI